MSSPIANIYSALSGGQAASTEGPLGFADFIKQFGYNDQSDIFGSPMAGAYTASNMAGGQAPKLYIQNQQEKDALMKKYNEYIRGFYGRGGAVMQ